MLRSADGRRQVVCIRWLVIVIVLLWAKTGLAACGDAIVDPGETCDDGNLAAGDCCSPTCTFEAAGSACADDGNPCSEDFCDASGTCTHPAGGHAACDDGDACTINDVCGDGVCAGTLVPEQCIDAALCRLARKRTGFDGGDRVGVDDQFGFFQAQAGRPRDLCVPASTSGAALVDPTTSLLETRLHFGGTFNFATWHVTDQFSTLDLKTLRGDRLLVATATSPVGPPAGPPPAGSANHYTCRRVRMLPGSSAPRRLAVTIADALGSHAGVLGAPKRLCSPTDINTAGTGMEHKLPRLLCYGVRMIEPPGSMALAVHTANQLGSGQLEASGATELCVPATAQRPVSPCATSGDECGLPCCRSYDGQRPDCTFDPVVADPRYRGCSGPTILVDRTHANFHQVTPESDNKPGRFWGFAKLLVRDGYNVRDSTTPFAALLPTTSAKIIVIANPQTILGRDALSAADVALLADWVDHGGSLLLSIDHPPFENAPALLAALGLESTGGGARQFTFTRANTGLNGTSVIANGTGPGSAINEVTTFTGTAFSISPMPPPQAQYEPVLTFPPDTPQHSVAGLLQGVAIQFGAGRVYVSGESGGLTAQNSFGMQFTPDNAQYVRNIIHWLDY